MSNSQISQLIANSFLEAEAEVVEQVLRSYLGQKPTKVDEFLIQKIHPFQDTPDYALHFDEFLLGYVKFSMYSEEMAVTFTPATLDDNVKEVQRKVSEGLISEKESEEKIDQLIDKWFHDGQ